MTVAGFRELGDRKGQSLDSINNMTFWWTGFELRECEELDDFRFVCFFQNCVRITEQHSYNIFYERISYDQASLGNSRNCSISSS